MFEVVLIPRAGPPLSIGTVWRFATYPLTKRLPPLAYLLADPLMWCFSLSRHKPQRLSSGPFIRNPLTPADDSLLLLNHLLFIGHSRVITHTPPGLVSMYRPIVTVFANLLEFKSSKNHLR